MKSLTNRLLGYPDDARLLIVNADDFGMCHAVNEAVAHVLQRGIVRSTTLMVPCPWYLDAAHFLATHPEIPFGVHLTALAEWPRYPWRPLICHEKVPSLVDEAGYFYDFQQMPAFLARVNLPELEMEFRAQIETVLAARLKPTHLDWHALRIDNRPDIANMLLRLAREYGLALRVRGRGRIEAIQARGFPTNDYDFLDSYQLDPASKAQHYVELLRALPSGLSEWAVHPGLDTPELLAIEAQPNHIRQSDHDFFTSRIPSDVIREEGIVLLDYRPLQAIWNEM